MTMPRVGALAVADRWQRRAAVALGVYFVAFLAFAILTQRGLVGDGAAYFVELLERRAVFSPEVSRWAANLLTQWPVLLALWAGVSDTRTLSWLHSFGLFYPSVVTLALSWVLLPAERKALFLLPLLGLVFGWMGSAYGIISQGQVMALWFWPTAFALAAADLRTGRGAALVLFLVLPTLLMHEAMCLLGPILATIAWRRAARETRMPVRWLWHLVFLWLIAGALLALYFTLVPLNPGDRAGFVEGLTRLYFLHRGHGRWNPPVAIALVAALLMLLCCRAEGWMRRSRPIWLPLFGALLAVGATAPLVFAGRFDPGLQLDARSWVVAVPLLLLAGLIAQRAGLLPIRPAARPLLAAILALAAAAQITWQVAASVRWNGFIAEVRRELASGRGYVPYETAFARGTPIGPAARDILATGWTFPYLSITLAPGGAVATIIGNPLPIGWQAFDPTRAADLPPAVGIDYADYVKALGTTP